MLFGGCDFYYSGCLSLSNSTYGLSGSGGVDIPTTGSPPPTSPMAYCSIRPLNDTVMFGGCSLTACDLNTTWGD